VPSSDAKLEEDTVLLVAGADRDIEKFSKG